MSADSRDNVHAMDLVRRELKKWEWQFKQTNGRKPRREDIKNDAMISAKYAEYDRLSGRGPKADLPQPRSQRADGESGGRRVLQDRSANAASATPRKSTKHSHDAPTCEDVRVEEAEEPTPAHIRLALGPTPQKDGAVLGLFDLLPAETPSKAAQSPSRTKQTVINGTPSKSAVFQSPDLAMSRTPQSSAKRFHLDVFGGTPLKRKREEDEGDTPSTVKRRFATPAFLRRSHTLPAISEEGTAEMAGGALGPFKKRGLVRSLSAIIQGLKKQEEERMDDEWDVLNEIEAEQRGEAVLGVKQNREVEMPLGPDQGAQDDDPGDEDAANAVDAEGRPRKPWKKKGLKRQTRRVVMRPVLHKPQKAVGNGEDGDSEGDGTAEKDVTGTADEAGAEHTESDKADQYALPKRKKTAKKSPVEAAPDTTNETRKPKKVNAAAHANFRKLKIKNKNSKAKGRGRFGRR